MKLDLGGYTVLPGLINAHDHLEFNLFPTLANGPYRNSAEWACDIHHPDRSPVREQLRVPLRTRLWWGALKNLLSGVTTVCHHNPYYAEFSAADFPVRVPRRYAWAHSLTFDVDSAARFRRAPRSWPFLIHAAEGRDAAARREIPALDEMGLLDARTVLIHGVALTPAHAALVHRRGASLVWCPTSNLTLLGRTVSRSVLRSRLPIALGTDSAVSAPVDLLDELRVARRFVPADLLYPMVSTIPAAMLRLPRAARQGDWIALRSAHQGTPALFDGSLAAVSVAGRMRLVAPELAHQLPREQLRRFQPLALEGRDPVLVDAPVRALRRAAEKHLGRDFRLAGKRVLA